MNYSYILKISRKKRAAFIGIIIIIALSFLHTRELRAEGSKLSGLILLQTQSYGRAWYISPHTGMRYYLKDKKIAYGIFKNSAQKVDSIEIVSGNPAILKKYKGMILTTIGSDTMTYVHPRTLAHYDIKNADQAFEVVKKTGIGATDALLATISMNPDQLLPDTAYRNVAYAKYDGRAVTASKDADILLPLASLTKLASALVLLDLNPDWDERITIARTDIDFPKRFVGDDQTSEVPIREGMHITFKSLWKAMLIASSNQATAALARSSGLSQEQFVARMNAKAHQLGLTKTRFFDCAGLDAHNTSTAKEMAILAHVAFQNQPIREGTYGEQFFITAYRTNGTAKKIAIANRNYSLLQFSPDASKTGFLKEAQRNVALTKNGTTMVVLHARSMRERNAIIKKLLSK